MGGVERQPVERSEVRSLPSTAGSRRAWPLGVCLAMAATQCLLAGFEAVCGPGRCPDVVGSPMGRRVGVDEAERAETTKGGDC